MSTRPPTASGFTDAAALDGIAGALWIMVVGTLASTLSQALAILLAGGDKGGADRRRFHK